MMLTGKGERKTMMLQNGAETVEGKRCDFLFLYSEYFPRKMRWPVEQLVSNVRTCVFEKNSTA